MIKLKEGFIMREEKIYSLFRKEREEVREFIQEQMRKRYICPLKSLQIALVFL